MDRTSHHWRSRANAWRSGHDGRYRAWGGRSLAANQAQVGMWVILAGLLLLSGTAVRGAGIAFELDARSEVRLTANLEAVQVADGRLSGQSLWDPYVYLRLPEDGLDVSALPHLTVRLYSSGPADVLDVYYADGEGRWGLGGTLPIQRGWVVYRADLRVATWHESSPQADARQWGGPSRRIRSFRLDPGNQAGRWVVVDRVELSAEPTGPLGASVEPRGQMPDALLTCAPALQAGEPIRATLTAEVQAPAGLTQGTALLRLTSGSTTLRAHLEAVGLAAGRVNLTHEFTTSRYSNGGTWTVVGEVLELDAEAPPGASVVVTNPRLGTVRPPATRIAPHGGAPALFVNGQPEPLITYLHHGGKAGELHREAAAAGLTLYSDWLLGSSQAGNLGQVSPGAYDYAAFDQHFLTVLDAVPEARFLPHIGVTAPRWWQEAHPEECCLYSNGARGPSSFASERWRTEMGTDLARLIAHLRQAPYADRILGYTVYSGYTAEWQMWATWAAHSDDYSEPALRAFRAWLRRAYGSDQALRAAWADPQVTLDTATLPTHERRRETSPFVRDPATDRQVIDLNRFNSDMTADAIRHFARVAKEACGGTQIVGTYYGYLAAHGARQQLCGHNALARILACPDVDYLMSPNMYLHREVAGTSTFMSATASVRLHGKLWLDESDLRSYLSDPASGYGRTTTVEDSVAVTWREFANVLTRRAAVSWFDMGGGWYSSEPMWETYRRQRPIAAAAFAARRPFHGDLAVFVDEASVDYYRFSGMTHTLVGETIAHLPHAGVAWDCYLLSDLASPALPDYRVYVLPNAVTLDDSTQAALLAKAERTGATILYAYAPGYATARGLEPARISQLTGMTTTVETSGGPAAYRFVPGHALGQGLGAASTQGPNDVLAPRPVITDPAAEVVARYVTGDGIAIARTARGAATVVYCASVALPPALLRNLAREAGAHVYCDSDDSVYTDDQYLALHAASAGEKTVRLRTPRRVTDLLGGGLIAERTDTVRRTLRRGETLFVQLD